MDVHFFEGGGEESFLVENVVVCFLLLFELFHDSVLAFAEVEGLVLDWVLLLSAGKGRYSA